MTSISGNNPASAAAAAAAAQIETNQPTATAVDQSATAKAPAGPQDEYEKMISQPLEQMLQNIGLGDSDLKGRSVSVAAAQQGHYNALVSGFTTQDMGTLQSHMASVRCKSKTSR